LRAGDNANNAPCGKLDQCYLVNVDSGLKVSLSNDGAVAVDKPNDRHTIICDTTGKIDMVTFAYDGQKHVESVKPWSMAGDTKDVTHNVPYLTALGQKEVQVTGQRDNNKVCFEKTFLYKVKSYSSSDHHDASATEGHDRLLSHSILLVVIQIYEH
jgi:hypothetical protein